MLAFMRHVRRTLPQIIPLAFWICTQISAVAFATQDDPPNVTQLNRFRAANDNTCGGGVSSTATTSDPPLLSRSPEWFASITPQILLGAQRINVQSSEGQNALKRLASLLSAQEAEAIFQFILRTDIYEFPLASLEAQLIKNWARNDGPVRDPDSLPALRVSHNNGVAFFLLSHYTVIHGRKGEAVDYMFPAGIHILRHSRFNPSVREMFAFLAPIAMHRNASKGMDVLVRAALEMSVENKQQLFSWGPSDQLRLDTWIHQFLDPSQVVGRRPPDPELISELVHQLFGVWRKIPQGETGHDETGPAIEALSLRIFNFLEECSRADLAHRFSPAYAAASAEVPRRSLFEFMPPEKALLRILVDDAEGEILSALHDLERARGLAPIKVETALGDFTLSLRRRPNLDSEAAVLSIEVASLDDAEDFRNLEDTFWFHGIVNNRQVVFANVPHGSVLRRYFESHPKQYELVGFHLAGRPATFRMVGR